MLTLRLDDDSNNKITLYYVQKFNHKGSFGARPPRVQGYQEKSDKTPQMKHAVLTAILTALSFARHCAGFGFTASNTLRFVFRRQQVVDPVSPSKGKVNSSKLRKSSFHSRLQATTSPNPLLDVFNQIDIDGGGTICVDELQEVRQVPHRSLPKASVTLTLGFVSHLNYPLTASISALILPTTTVAEHSGNGRNQRGGCGFVQDT